MHRHANKRARPITVYLKTKASLTFECLPKQAARSTFGRLPKQVTRSASVRLPDRSTFGGESLAGRELAVEQVEYEPAAEQTEFESAVFLVNMESLLSHQRRYRTNSEEGNSYNREF